MMGWSDREKWYSVLHFDVMDAERVKDRNFWRMRRNYRHCLKANRRMVRRCDYVCRGLRWKYWDNF